MACKNFCVPTFKPPFSKKEKTKIFLHGSSHFVPTDHTWRALRNLPGALNSVLEGNPRWEVPVNVMAVSGGRLTTTRFAVIKRVLLIFGSVSLLSQD